MFIWPIVVLVGLGIASLIAAALLFVRLHNNADDKPSHPTALGPNGAP